MSQPTLMRQVVVSPAENIRVDRVPWPSKPDDGQVLVHSRLIGTCGTDAQPDQARVLTKVDDWGDHGRTRVVS